MLKIPRAGFAREGSRIVLTLPSDYIYMADCFAAKVKDTVRADLYLPHNPRSTGWKSQNHHINGHCQQIAIETGASFDAVKYFMKREAIGRGWPVDTLPNGEAIPASEGDPRISSYHAYILIEIIHQFAAEWMIALIEEASEQ